MEGIKNAQILMQHKNYAKRRFNNAVLKTYSLLVKD